MDILDGAIACVKCPSFDEHGLSPLSPSHLNPSSRGWRIMSGGDFELPTSNHTTDTSPSPPPPSRGATAPRLNAHDHRLLPLVVALWILVPLSATAQERETTPLRPPTEQQGSTTDPLRILFIGNSYTYYNDLPGTVRRLAASRQPAIEVIDAMVTRPGYSLDLHWRDEQVKNTIGSGTAIDGEAWDLVVIQEQSQAPLNKQQRMLDHARLLATKARSVGARPVLYMTWAPLRRPAMIEILATAYEDVGKAIEAPVAPVGRAWQRAIEQRPDLRLHSPDGSHPAPTGTYLAACVLYATLTGEDPRGLSPLDLDAETATFLQQVAWRTVHGEPAGKPQG